MLSGPSVAPRPLSDIPTRLDRGLHDVHVGVLGVVSMAWLAATLHVLHLFVTFHLVKAVIAAIYSNHPQLLTRYQIRPQH